MKKSIFSRAEKFFFRKVMWILAAVFLAALGISTYCAIDGNYAIARASAAIFGLVFLFAAYFWAIKRKKHQMNRADRTSAWSTILDLVALVYPLLFWCILLWCAYNGMHALITRALL